MMKDEQGLLLNGLPMFVSNQIPIYFATDKFKQILISLWFIMESFKHQ